MTFCNVDTVDTVEEVAVELIVELGVKRCVQVVCSRSQDLVRAHWRALWLSLHDCLCLPILLRRSKVGMPIQVPLFELDRLDLHGLDLLEILLVVQAIAEYVAKSAQCALESIGSCLFLGLFERRCFSFSVLYRAVANVLVIVSSAQIRNSLSRTSWYVPSRSVIRTTIDNPKLTLPF